MKNFYTLKKSSILKKIVKNLRREDLLPPILFKLVKFIRQGSIYDEKFLYKHPIIKTFSWKCEDLVLSDLFENENIGHYLDIGCNDPILGNNTYRLYLKGWTGINIDLDKNSIEKYENIRSNDTNLSIAVSSRQEQAIVVRHGADSSISELIPLGAIKKHINIEQDEIVITKSILQIFEEYIQNKYDINILNIDVEGNELAILKANNWKLFRPTVILIELNASISELQNFFNNINYMVIFINEHNAIFLDELTQHESIRNKLIYI